jgi:hypothetical protein
LFVFGFLRDRASQKNLFIQILLHLFQCSFPHGMCRSFPPSGDLDPLCVDGTRHTPPWRAVLSLFNVHGALRQGRQKMRLLPAAPCTSGALEGSSSNARRHELDPSELVFSSSVLAEQWCQDLETHWHRDPDEHEDAYVAPLDAEDAAAAAAVAAVVPVGAAEGAAWQMTPNMTTTTVTATGTSSAVCIIVSSSSSSS